MTTLFPLEDSSNPLDAFPPETPKSDPRRLASAPSSSGGRTVSLAALKAAGAVVSGDEAIAIGQAICRVLMTAQLLHRMNPGSSASGGSRPVAADAVFIDANGRVSATVEDPSNDPAMVQAVGQILSGLLPAEARTYFQPKILWKTPPSRNQFVTVDVLAQALAEFEPANGTELIQAAFKRWEQHERQKSGVGRSILRPTPPPARSLFEAGSRYQWAAIAGAVVVGVTMIGISGWFLITRSTDEQRTPTASNAPMPEQAQDGSGVPMLAPEPSVVSVEATDAGSTNPDPATPAEKLARSEPAPPPAPRSAPRVRPPQVSNRTAQGPTPPAPAQPPAAAAAAAPPAARTEASAPSVSRPSEDVGRGGASSRATPAAAAPVRSNAATARSSPIVSTAIYDGSNAGVIPPTPIMPQLLGFLHPSSPGVRFDALTIAVVVNADGTVESVKGVNEPQNVGESLLLTSALSVVKSWHFRPATKDGAPVKFRHIVPLREVTGSAR